MKKSESIVDVSLDDDETFMVVIIRTKYESTLPTYVMIDGKRYVAQ